MPANKALLNQLQKGVAHWNQWREKNPRVRPNFDDANLEGEDLSGANFRDAFFRRAKLNRANLSEAILTNADISEGSLNETILKGANLCDATLNSTELIGAELDNANLTNAKLEGAILRDATLTDANLSGTEFNGAELDGAIIITEQGCAHFNHANLSWAILSKANLCQATLIGANLSNATCNEINLCNAKLNGATLQEANLSDANMENADCSLADFTSAQLPNTNLNGTILDGATLSQAWLYNTQRTRWSIKGVICNSVYFDQKMEHIDFFDDGEFERNYDGQIRVRLLYQDEITTLELLALPALITLLEEASCGYKLRLESFRRAPDQVTIYLVVESEGNESQSQESLKQLQSKLEEMGKQVIEYQNKAFAEKDRQAQAAGQLEKLCLWYKEFLPEIGDQLLLQGGLSMSDLRNVQQENAPANLVTNPTGRSFLSYRRSRSHEAMLLIAAQRDRGIPTWQDVDNLREQPLEPELRRELDSAETANAVLWITPEVATSAVIQRIEAPAILDRERKKDGFFIIPVLAGGAKYDEVNHILDPVFTLEDLRQWNLRSVANDPINAGDAAQVARWVLQRRLETLHRMLPKGQPLRLSLHTRKKLPWQPGSALWLDWFDRFDGREAKPGAWAEYLLPALEDVAAAIERYAPGRTVEADGQLSLAAATALGCTFLATRRLPIAWRQFTPGRGEQIWSIDVPREPSGFEVKTQGAETGSDDLVVLVMVNDNNVELAFNESRRDLPPFRAITKVRKPEGIRHDLATPGMAADVAYLVAEELRRVRHEVRRVKCVHLFMAVPAGLAMMIGQLLNTFGQIQTYEHITEGGVNYYRPAALLQPAE